MRRKMGLSQVSKCLFYELKENNGFENKFFGFFSSTNSDTSVSQGFEINQIFAQIFNDK